jgi:hypothetical protein
MKELLVKAGLSAVIGGVGSSILFGDSDVNILGMVTKASVFTGAAVGLGSIASDLVSENIIENMDIAQNVKTIEGTLVKVGVCGAASSAVLIANGMPVSNLPQSFLLGSASKLGGDYAEQMLFSKSGFVPLF